MIGSFLPGNQSLRTLDALVFRPRRGFVVVLLLLASLHLLNAQGKLLPVFHFQRVNGIFSNFIRSRVVRDEEGFAWIGTSNGLARYDGYSVKDYRNITDDPYSLSSNYISALLVDKKQRLWVGTYDTGLSMYDRATDRFFNLLPHSGDTSWYQIKPIAGMLEDRHGNLWLAARFGGVVRMEIPTDAEIKDPDSLSNRIRFRAYHLGTRSNNATDLSERADGRILVASDSGLIILDPTSHSISRLNIATPLGCLLDSTSVQCFCRDSNEVLWVGTGSEGLFRIDWGQQTVRNFRHVKGDTLSLMSNNVQDIATDGHGNLWIAGDVGIQLFSPATGQRTPYLTVGSAPPGALMTKLSLDRTRTLWIGTGFGGVYSLSPKSRLLPHFGLQSHDGVFPSALATIEHDREGNTWFTSFKGMIFQIDIPSQTVRRVIDVFRGKKVTYGNYCSFIDRYGTFWFGAWGLGLFRIDLASGQVWNYGTESGLGKTNIVNSIAPASGDSLWIAAHYDGLKKFCPGTGKFAEVPGFPKGEVSTVTPDRRGVVWVTSSISGITILDPTTGAIKALRHNPLDQRSLSSDHVQSVYEDPAGRMWIGTGNMINLWDPTTKAITRYPNLAYSTVASASPLCSDAKGRLWVYFRNGGLSMLDPLTGAYSNFDSSDGFCGTGESMTTLDDGMVVISGWQGLNIFHPDSIDRLRPAPPLVLTRMSINDVPIAPPLLVRASGFLKLPYSRNVLEFEFAAIDIDAPTLIQYQYQLEGLEEEWVKVKGRRYVRYAGLPPGDYIFRVRASSVRTEWPDQEIALPVSIAPPWWKSRWAYGGYLLLLIGTATAAYRLRVKQLRLAQRAELAHFQAERLAELDKLKSRFFANISHEFRTPLTLISGPLKGMLDEEREEKKKQSLSMMQRNSQRLLRLINQLLDLSKLEAGAMKLRATRLNIVPLIQGLTNSFESSAGLRGISVQVVNDRPEIEVYCDKDIVEKILTNLLSNAIKFTPEGGAVVVSVQLTPLTPPSLKGNEEGREGEFVEIAVADTGIGIPPDQLERVFDRFYQVDASQTREHEGSGIGLALVKELVELHHGTIDVQSEVGKGTTFTVLLPLGRRHLKDDEIIVAPVSTEAAMLAGESVLADKTIEGAPEEVEDKSSRGEKPIVLVVEDNADVRAYLKDYLVSAYQVTEARDGEEGISKALETIPDLIISDVMMPKRDGYEVCKILKLDEKTSHIPIILLTAKAASENRIEGLETGADDYLVKPFEPKELLARVKNLIDVRRKLRERFSTSVPLRPGEIAVTSADDEFLQRAKRLVEGRMADEKFSVEELATELFMSRSQLHRKLTALTNLSAGDFIRYLRLHRAMDLLRSGSGTISEIAYKVGFSDPSHFSRSFRTQFGVTPSESLKGSETTGPSENAP